MPLPYMKITRRSPKDWVDQEVLAFCTIGPVGNAHSKIIVELYTKLMGKNLKRLLSSHEVSKDGYEHLHIMSEAHTKMAYARLFKQVQKMVRDVCGPREGGLQYSVRYNKIPSSEQVKGKQLYGWAVGEHYLTSPTKVKDVGDTFVLEVESEGFNIYQELEKLDESIAQKEKHLRTEWPPIWPSEKVFYENQIAKLKSAKKYYFWWYTDFKKKFPSVEPHHKAWACMTFEHGRGFEKNTLPPIPKIKEFS